MRYLTEEDVYKTLTAYYHHRTDAQHAALREALSRVPAADPGMDEWCTGCREYDHEKHCCPRFNRVIRETIEEMKGDTDGHS